METDVSSHTAATPDPVASDAGHASAPTVSDPPPQLPVAASSDPHLSNGVDHAEEKAVVNSASPIYSVLLELMKEKHATEWFGVPVDPVALNIPTYFTIIKHPMDLGTIKKRVESGSHYHSEDEVIADVNLTFNNATTFNPATNAVHTVAKKLQKKFDTLLAKPRNTSNAAAAARKRGRKPGTTDGAGAAAHPTDAEGPQRKRQAVPAPVAVAADGKTTGHDNGVAAAGPIAAVSSPVGDGRFDADACSRILDSIMSHDCSGPFLAPVDPIALEIPEYSEIVKHPMDLGTVKKKLRAGSYRSNEHFASDMRLIWDNCILFNGLDKGVSRMARQLQQKFDRLYSKLLP